MSILRRVSIVAGLAGLAAGGVVGTLSILSRRIEAAAPPQGRFIDIDGNSIHYLDQGSGPAVVLVHGLGGNGRNFTYALADLLAKRFRVLTLDRPGSGYSTRVADADADLRVQADLLTRLLDALAVDKPILVGHSLGGALVLAAALDNPGRYRGLALITPLVMPQDEPPEALKALAIRSPLLRRLVAWSIALPLSIARRDAVLAGLFSPDAVPGDFPIAGGGALGARPVSFYHASTDLAALPDALPGLAARYPSLDVPVAVIVGTGDTILDPRRHGEALEGVAPDVRITRVEGGHMIPLAQPRVVADWLTAFADSL